MLAAHYKTNEADQAVHREHMKRESQEREARNPKRAPQMPTLVTTEFETRLAQVAAAQTATSLSSVGVDSDRKSTLSRMFMTADINVDGRLSLQEYTAAGDPQRFDAVQGGYKALIDTDGDGTVSEDEAKAAAGFDFAQLDSLQLGDIGPEELKNAFKNKGWLNSHNWHVALELSGDESGSERLSHMVTYLVEMQFLPKSTERARDSLPCENPASVTVAELSLAARTRGASYLRPTPRQTLDGHRLATNGSFHFRDSVADNYGQQTQNRQAGGAQLKSLDNSSSHSLIAAVKVSTARKMQDRRKAILLLATQSASTVILDVLATDFCWITTYDRGVGRPADCGEGYEQRGQMCYRKCEIDFGEGWYRDGWDIEFCQESCGKNGGHDVGLFCRGNGGTQWTKKLLWQMLVALGELVLPNVLLWWLSV